MSEGFFVLEYNVTKAFQRKPITNDRCSLECVRKKLKSHQLKDAQEEAIELIRSEKRFIAHLHQQHIAAEKRISQLPEFPEWKRIEAEESRSDVVRTAGPFILYWREPGIELEGHFSGVEEPALANS